jgi:GT2 family glycosyltransferase
MSTERNNSSPVIVVSPGEQAQGQPQSPPAAKEVARMVSIVVPCCGQLEYTRLCVPSLLQHSRRPYELIFVDIGSLDGTSDYLAGVADASPVRVEVVRTAVDSGFQAACSEGLAQARGEFIVWLSNDTIVPEDWLQQLVALCSGHELIGMVGPMSNYAPQSQRVSQVPYRLLSRKKGDPVEDSRTPRTLLDIDAVNCFAREWREQHKGQWFETERLGGFCLLLKRAVLQRVSFFDEQAEKGIFDANALSWRIRQAGYHLACCRDLFIHHFGSRLAAT